MIGIFGLLLIAMVLVVKFCNKTLKIVLSIIIIPVQILSVVILGRFFMRTSQEVIKRVLSFILFFSLFLFIILFIAKRYILTYYSFSLVSDVLWSFSLVLFSSLFANLSVFIGDNIMVSNSLEKQLIKSSIYSSLFVFPLLIITLCFVDNSLFALCFIKYWNFC